MAGMAAVLAGGCYPLQPTPEGRCYTGAEAVFPLGVLKASEGAGWRGHLVREDAVPSATRIQSAAIRVEPDRLMIVWAGSEPDAARNHVELPIDMAAGVIDGYRIDEVCRENADEQGEARIRASATSAVPAGKPRELTMRFGPGGGGLRILYRTSAPGPSDQIEYQLRRTNCGFITKQWCALDPQVTF